MVTSWCSQHLVPPPPPPPPPPPLSPLSWQGVKDRIPAGATLVFEVELRKLKLAKEREAEVATETSVTSSLTPSPTSHLPPPSRVEAPPPSPPTSRERSTSVKDRTQSIEDHMTAPSEEGEDSQRSKLLSKMSRLGGQAILPPGSLPGHQVSQGGVARGCGFIVAAGGKRGTTVDCSVGFYHLHTTWGDVITARNDVIAAGDDVIAARNDVITARNDVITAGDDVIATGNDVIAAGDDVITAGDDGRWWDGEWRGCDDGNWGTDDVTAAGSI